MAMNQQAKRCTHRQCAINRHPVPRHYFAGVFRPDDTQSPGQSARQQLAFTKAKNQTPDDQQGKFERSGDGQNRRQQQRAPRQTTG